MPIELLVGLVGLVGSFTSALLGSGGGLVMLSLLLYLPPALGMPALDVRTATGLGATQILCATALATLLHGRRGRVDRRLALWVAPFMTVATVLAAILSAVFPAKLLIAAFAGIATTAGALMFVPVRHAVEETAWAGAFNRPLSSLVGLVAGAFVGLIGAGTFLLTPGFLHAHVPTRIAIGTTLAVSIVAALAAALGKAATGQVPLLAALAVLVGTVFGAQLGARVSGRLPPAVLRALLGGLISLIALRAWADVLRP
jgi:uncharacterized membrane protein YfcA